MVLFNNDSTTFVPLNSKIVVPDAPAKFSDYEIVKGTENEVPIYRNRVKLFRFRDNQWKERGIGNARLMRDKATQKVRLVMR
jgi:hypothetical protein